MNSRVFNCWYAALALTSITAIAQEIEPRSYTNAPIGVNFLAVSYATAKGDVAFDSSVPLTDARLESDLTIVAFATVFALGGQSAKLAVAIPYVTLDGSAQFLGDSVVRNVSGLGDAKVRLSANFFGAPALPLSEYSTYVQDFVVGGSLQVSIPSGQYDSNKLLNIGANRWYVKPELGFSQRLGDWSVEGSAAATLFTDNNDFFGGKRREQEPIYTLQGHLVRYFPTNIWVALTGTWLGGGRTTVNGIRGNDLQQNSRMGLTLALPIDRKNSLKLNYSSGVSARTGSNFALLGITWQLRWGGGL